MAARCAAAIVRADETASAPSSARTSASGHVDDGRPFVAQRCRSIPAPRPGPGRRQWAMASRAPRSLGSPSRCLVFLVFLLSGPAAPVAAQPCRQSCRLVGLRPFARDDGTCRPKAQRPSADEHARSTRRPGDGWASRTLASRKEEADLEPAPYRPSTRSPTSRRPCPGLVLRRGRLGRARHRGLACGGRRVGCPSPFPLSWAVVSRCV